MSNLYRFSADRTTRMIDLGPQALAKFSTAVPGAKSNFTVSDELGRAAENELLGKARDLADQTGKYLWECIFEIVQREPQLMRLYVARTLGVLSRFNEQATTPDVSVS